MSWEWSHSTEALEKGRKELAKKSKTFLAECYGEWRCEDITQAENRFLKELEKVSRLLEDDDYVDVPAELTTDPLVDGRYEKFKKDAMQTDMETLVDYIWQRAEEQCTCDNGGQHPWMCPHGCHTVRW